MMTDKAGNGAATIRDVEPYDMPVVGRLFLKAFRKRLSGTEPPPQLLDRLREIYVENPWYDPQIRSKVFVNETGEVCGFIGVSVQKMTYAGRALRVAYAGSLAVSDPERYPLAGARLVRGFINGPQDISVTETANATATRMWQKLGIPLDTQYSLNWIRLLRPASAVMSILERKHRSIRLVAPLAHLADAAFARLAADPFRPLVEPGPRRLQFTEVDRTTFDAAALDLSHLYALRPLWDQASLDWFSSHASRKRNFGQPSYRVAYGKDGKPVAAYVYFHRRDDLAWLLQSFVTQERAGDLIDDMLVHAHALGCSAIRGAAQPWLHNALVSRRTVFLSRNFFLAHARDASLLEPFRQATALASGLAGESWMRLIGDHFED